MPCTEIRVYDLSAEASNRLGGATEVLLDVPNSVGIRLSKSVEQLSVLNKISTEGVLGFSLPFSQVNDAVFIDFKTPLTVDNRVKFYTVSVRTGGHAIRFDRLLVKGKNEVDQTWDVELRHSPDHWVELSSQLKINEIDYGSFTLTRSFVLSNWNNFVYEGDYKNPNTGQRPYLWAPADYGGWVDQTQPEQRTIGRFKAIAVEDLRPFISLPYLLRGGFCKIGWSLEGVIFDTDYVKRLWLYALTADYYDRPKTKAGGTIVGRRFERKRWDNTAVQYLTFDELVEGGVAWQVPGDLAGIKNVPNVALKYRFQMQGEFHNDRSSPFTAVFNIFEVLGNDALYYFSGQLDNQESLIVEFEPNEKKMVLFDMTVTLQPDQMAAIHIGVTPDTDGFYIEKGLHVKISPANQALSTDDVISVQQLVSDETSLLDWLKAFVHIVDGRIETDWDTKTVTIHPNKKSNVFGETVPGFLLDEEPAEDISDLIIVNSVKSQPVRPDLKRYTRIEFAESSDAYIRSLNLTEPAHSRKLLNGLDLPDEVEPIRNPIIEPTLEGKPSGIASGAGGRHPLPYLPRLWDNTEGNRSFAIRPRLLYAYGLVRQINPAPISNVDELTSFFFDAVPNPSNDGLIEEFAYLSQLPTWKVDPAPEADPYPNVVFGTQPFDLFVAFRLRFTQDARGGTILDALMFMRMSKYNDENFRRLKRFSHAGLQLRVPMVDIRDFDSCSEIPTPVLFFQPPVETECCDLPCGCQFTTCDYYSDFGVYMRNDTLSDMRLSSFVVDGIELVSSPISFGPLKMIDIAGQQYVMNLIDTLNSVGAPYFSFDVSTRNSPAKGKRFFSIKRPACVPFRIVITYNGDEVYLYTQAEQKTAWFSGGSWEDFGYGGETYGDPVGCVTITEY